MADAAIHLLDVNLAIALLDEAHVHHAAAHRWFAAPRLRWALCAFTEAGVLRYFTRPGTGGLTVAQVSAMLERLAQASGHHYLPIAADWQTLARPFARRIHGHNQITDAYLLGLAVHEKLVLATFDRAILHLAGEHARHVVLLPAA